jgi:hypothetical protein
MLLLASCGPIDPGPPLDEDGNEIIRPGAFDSYLGIQADYAETQGVRPALRFIFDAFVEEDELVDFGVVVVASAGIVNGGRVTWHVSTRTMTFRPFSNLVSGLEYKPQFDASRLFSVTGAPLGPVNLPTFVVDETVTTEEPPPPPLVGWAEIDDLFEAKCRSCHAEPSWQLNPLTYDSLIGRRSAQVDRMMVVPFDPADSYLLHKCIPDYPTRRFTVQPPPWSDAEPLSEQELFMLERWISTGARNE